MIKVWKRAKQKEVRKKYQGILGELRDYVVMITQKGEKKPNDKCN